MKKQMTKKQKFTKHENLIGGVGSNENPFKQTQNQNFANSNDTLRFNTLFTPYNENQTQTGKQTINEKHTANEVDEILWLCVTICRESFS